MENEPSERTSGTENGKRILFIVSSLGGGGAERTAVDLSNYWCARGHQVLLLATFSGRGECMYAVENGVRVEYLADKIHSTKQSLFNKVRRLLALRTVIKSFAPDVILSFLPDANVAALLSSRGLHIPTVVTEQVYPPAMPIGIFWETLRNLTYPWADSIISLTRDGLQWQSECAPNVQGHIIANPVVLPLTDGPNKVAPAEVVAPSKKVLLAAGRLNYQKGFEVLLDAFAQLADRFPDWDLIIAGEGELRAPLEQQRHELGLDSRVHMPGRVGNITDWFNRADVFVVSSHFEGICNVLVEAQVHGVPAVSIDCTSGPRDVIRDGKSGILVPPEQGAGGLARELAVVMDDENMRLNMGKEAAKALERFNIDHIASKWDKVLGLTPESTV